MSAFAVLRHSRNLARLVLAGFLLTLTCAIAAPVLNPQSTTMVCTASGDVKLVVVGGEQDGEAPAASHHALDCVMCLALAAPPALASGLGLINALPGAGVLVGRMDAVHEHTAAPPPARGPPLSS